MKKWTYEATFAEKLKARITLIVFCASLFVFSHHAWAAPKYSTNTGETLRLIVKKNGVDITKKTLDVYAGQKMHLVASVSNDVAMTAKSWTVDSAGKPIANWVANSTNASVDENIELHQSQINFYWLKAGSALTVSFSATVNGKPLDTYAKFNVKRPAHSISTPTGELFARRISTINPLYRQIPVGKAMGYGDLAANAIPGIAFAADFPDGLQGGKIQWVQIINFSRWTYRTATTTTPGQRITPGLDQTYPYQGDVFSTNDSPSIAGLGDSVIEASRSDSYTMYLMWQPPGQNSIYIPLRRVDWTWSATAADNAAGNWALQSGTGATPTQAYTDAPPVWTRNSNPP